MTPPDEFEDNLRSVVSKYLDKYVTRPALETVTNNFEGQAHMASMGNMILIIADSIRKYGIDYDREYLTNLPKEDIKKRLETFGEALELEEGSLNANNEVFLSSVNYLKNDNSKKYLLEYLIRELNWIIISILSASYISAFVLMRSAFELVVGIATHETGRMTDRIYAIQGLNSKEKKKIKDLWYRLCAWGHPYGKWLKEICPIYISHDPIYHPELFILCKNEFVQLVDFFIAVATSKFELNGTELQRRLVENNIDLTGFDLLCSRLKA